MTWLKFTRPRTLRYHVSRFVPMHMHSIYGVVGQTALAEGGVIDQTGEWREQASWWQWHGHIFRHRITRLS